MTKPDELIRLIPYQTPLLNRVLIRDEDLQMELSRSLHKGEKKIMAIESQIPYEFSNDQPLQDSKREAKGKKILQKTMQDAAENFEMMMDIHLKLENAYKEIKKIKKSS